MAVQDWEAVRRAYEAGEFRSVAALAREMGVPASTLRYHIKKWQAGQCTEDDIPAERCPRPAQEECPAPPRAAWDHLLSSAREMARLVDECPDSADPKRLNELAGALEKIQKGLTGCRETAEQDGALALAQAIRAAAERRQE